MTPAAIITFVLVAGFVWVGFLVILGIAIGHESRKAREEA